MESTVLVKAFALLESLASEPDEVSLARLSKLSGMTKPTAHRILSTLISLGYVERTQEGVYRLTPRLSMMTRGFERGTLVRVAEPVLRALFEETGETVNLGMLCQDAVVYLRVIESRHPLRRVASGEDDPFYCTALGRAIVAHLSEPVRERLLRHISPEPRTDQTVTDLHELRLILEQVREDGHSVEVDQTDLGVTCVGAPVFQAGVVRAAISVSVPSVRCDDTRVAELAQAVHEAAEHLTRELNQSAGVLDEYPL